MMYFKDKTSKFALSIIIKSLLSNLLPVDIRRDIHTGVFMDKKNRDRNINRDLNMKFNQKT